MTPLSTQINPSLFQTSSPDKVYTDDSFKANLLAIHNSIKEKKKIVLISGKKNSGKKTLIQKAFFDLKNEAHLVNVKNENLDYEQLIDTTGKSLEKDFSTFATLEERIARIKTLLNKKKIQHVGIAFDQSIQFKRTVIENGLLLVNSSLSEASFFHLFITGLPDLSKQLQQSGFPESVLNDSCSLQVKPLSEENVRSYINHHIQHLDNQGKDIFSNEAIKQIIKYSKGLPGLVNRLCSLALLTANVEEKSSVSLAMVNEVLENSLFLGNEFDYTSEASQNGNSFSVDNILDDNLTFSKTSTHIKDPTPTPMAQPPKSPSKPVKQKPVAKNQNSIPQTSIEKKLRSQEKPVDISSLTTPDPRKKTESQDLELEKLIESVNKNKRVNSQKTKQTPVKTTTPKKSHKPSKTKTATTTTAAPITPTPKRIIPERQYVETHPTKKSPFLSAFSLGVIVSSLVGAGLYFFQFKNTTAPVPQVASSNPSSFDTKRKIPQQQLEARLNYLEQQLKNQQPQYSKNSQTQISKQNPNDYIASLPETAAGREEITTEPPKIIHSPVENNNIQELLVTAKQQLDDKKLMTPVNDNAWSTYNKILESSPGNQEALTGINKIKDTYILWARHEIKKGNPKHATYLFKKALEILPDDPEILSAILTLEGKKPVSTRGNGAFSKNNLFKLVDSPKGIEKLLAIAELQISRKNLVTPNRNSAFTIYKIILNRFPRHTSARSGLQTIKETYIKMAKKEIAQENYKLAESLYSKALIVAPADPEIVSDLDQLRETIRN